MNDSTNVAPVFISDSPDWSKPVQVVIANKTTIGQTRNEGRQRAKWRNQPKYSISYFLTGLNTEEFSARRTKMIQELGAPVVCPIWTDDFEAEYVAGLRVSFPDSLARSKFKPGGYAMVDNSGVLTFRIVAAIGANYVDFLTGSPATLPAVVYPCILGMRAKNSAAFGFATVDNTDETITVEEL